MDITALAAITLLGNSLFAETAGATKPGSAHIIQRQKIQLTRRVESLHGLQIEGDRWGTALHHPGLRPPPSEVVLANRNHLAPPKFTEANNSRFWRAEPSPFRAKETVAGWEPKCVRRDQFTADHATVKSSPFLFPARAISVCPITRVSAR